MTNHEVEKYRKRVRVLHWIHSGAFVLLFLTGLVFIIPALGFLGESSWIHLLHRIGAAIFVIMPIIYLITNPKSAVSGLKLAFTWGSNDIGWVKAIPAYYFRSDGKSMPPQDKLNTGQKFWWLLVLVFGVIFIITGGSMLFAKTSASPALLQRMVLIHDIAFIVTSIMFFVHIYNGVFHPYFNEAWRAMTSGKISTEYAKEHHGKWYAEISRGKSE